MILLIWIFAYWLLENVSVITLSFILFFLSIVGFFISFLSLVNCFLFVIFFSLLIEQKLIQILPLSNETLKKYLVIICIMLARFLSEVISYLCCVYFFFKYFFRSARSLAFVCIIGNLCVFAIMIIIIWFAYLFSSKYLFAVSFSSPCREEALSVINVQNFKAPFLYVNFLFLNGDLVFFFLLYIFYFLGFFSYFILEK
jgi:hypothetical protein